MVPQKERRTNADRAAGEYLITVHAGSNTMAILQGFETFGVREMKKISANLFLLKVDRDPSPEVMQQRGRQIEAIKSIEPNYIYRTQ